MAVHGHLPIAPDHTESSSGGEPHEIFGDFILFKLLKRNTLGSLYRAGRVGDNAVEQIVSLRLFSGAEIDGRRFWEGCHERAPLHQQLRGGPFSDGVGFGLEDKVPYVAHDYVFGRSLTELLETSRSKNYPVSLEYTLYIMDRIAIALRNAYEVRLDQKRVTHGFLLPDFVHLSAEGEVRLSGFEFSGGLLSLNSILPARAESAGYISPEVNAGQSPKACDDVYSMGSIFGELLTGQPLPPLNPAESSRWVESAQVESEGTPLPDNVRNLLRESLLPRDQRIQTAEQWHKALIQITEASEYSPTTFNLAFFMHTLFGEDLDQEATVVEAEKLAEVPSLEPQPVPAPKPKARPAPAVKVAARPEPELKPEPVAEPEPVEEIRQPLFEILNESELGLESSGASEDPPAEVRSRGPLEARSISAPSSRPSAAMLTLGAAVVLLLAAVIGYFAFDLPLLGGPGRAAEPVEVDSMLPDGASLDGEDGNGLAEAAEPAVIGADAVVPPLSPEELESQVRDLVKKRGGALEASLRRQYDNRLVGLRTQLDEARQAAERAKDRKADIAANQQGAQPTVSTPESSPPATLRKLSVPSLKVTQPMATSPAPVIEIPQAAPEPTRSAESLNTAPASAQPAGNFKPGSLVQLGPGVVPPKLTRQPRAVYPSAAARLKRKAKVKVRVLVDETGKPIQIEQLGDKIGLGFDQAAKTAAAATRWSPATKDGIVARMWVEISIDFRP